MTKVVPVQLENGALLYIEAEGDEAQEQINSNPIVAQYPQNETGEQRRQGSKGIGDFKLPPRPNPAQSMQMLQNTIRTYALYCLDAFKNLGDGNLTEVTLEFGVSLSADAGIPYIAGGKAQSNLKITVKCAYNQPDTPSNSGPESTPTAEPTNLGKLCTSCNRSLTA